MYKFCFYLFQSKTGDDEDKIQTGSSSDNLGHVNPALDTESDVSHYPRKVFVMYESYI